MTPGEEFKSLLDGNCAEMVQKAIDKAVKEQLDYELLTAVEVKKQYRIKDAALRRVEKTHLPGYTTPRYLRKNVKLYLDMISG